MPETLTKPTLRLGLASNISGRLPRRPLFLLTDYCYKSAEYSFSKRQEIGLLGPSPLIPGSIDSIGRLSTKYSQIQTKTGNGNLGKVGNTSNISNTWIFRNEKAKKEDLNFCRPLAPPRPGVADVAGVAGYHLSDNRKQHIVTRDSMISTSTGRIYQIVNDVDDLKYIGATIQTLAQRMTVHRSHAKTKTSPLYHHIKTLGVEHFTILLLEEHDAISREDLRAREHFHILAQNTVRHGLNGKYESRTCEHGIRRVQCPECKILDNIQPRAEEPRMRCSCGAKFKVERLSEHVKTAKHLTYVVMTRLANSDYIINTLQQVPNPDPEIKQK